MTLLDLTQPIAEGMPFNPDHFGPEITPYASIEPDGWRATRLVLDSHLGTHVDAPSHFVPEGITLDQVDLARLVGPADIVRIPDVRPRAPLGSKHLPPTTAPRLLLHTGWAESRYGEPAYFTEYPFISPELAQEMVRRGVQLVGIDGPSVDYEPGETHHILLEADILIVENLTNTSRVPDRIDLTVLPLPIVGGDGCPVRAVASFEGPPR
jgi:kynurenine formamidase